VLHVASKVYPNSDIVNVKILERDVGRITAQVDAIASVAADLKTFDREICCAFNINGVLSGRGR
jgi:hypothetical protein